MEINWGLVIFVGSVLIAVAGIFIYEAGKTPEQIQQEIQRAQERHEKERLSRQIVEVTLLGISGTQFKRGGVGGALLGAFIGGLSGAIVGAALRSGKGVPLVSFAVKYGNGEVIIRQCAQGSSEYKSLMKRVTELPKTDL